MTGMALSRKRLASLFLAASLTPSLALAHAHLQQQQPAADSVATAQTNTLTLTFSEGVEPAFSGVTLTGPQQQKVATGSASLASGNDRQLIVPIKAELSPGNYRVDWHVVSVDSHKTQGSYQFSVK
jgi:methionine-rich copper-binding protein CopC